MECLLKETLTYTFNTTIEWGIKNLVKGCREITI